MLRDPQSASFDRETLLVRLDDSLTTLEWAVSLVPDEWVHRSPGGTRLSQEEGAWSVAMNLAHLALYEERLPIPVLESILAGGDGTTGVSFREPSALEEDAVALAAQPASAIMDRLRAARDREAALARSFPASQWVAPSTRAWGASGIGPKLHSPARILAKSFKHTWEHGNSILTVALFVPRELLSD